MRRVHIALAPLMLFVFTTLGCETTTDASALGTSASAVTSIFLDPSFFMGDLPCAALPGAVQSYVAHIYDATNGQVVALPASPPISCSASVTFQQVVVGRKYRIKVDGYDVPASALIPVGGMSSGSRSMLLRSNKNAGPVTPLWETHCDDVAALKDTSVPAPGCMPFPTAPTATGVSVDPRVAMKSSTPALACKQAGGMGDVVALNVRPDDPSLPALLDVPCADDGPALPAFTQGITSGQTYTFRIEALAVAGGPVVWGSSCFASAKEGLVVDATCDPMRPDGAMEVVINSLLGAETCSDANVVKYDVAYAGPPKESVLGVACGKSVRFSPLVPGMHAATVVGYRQGGDVALEATCSALVEAGSVTLATCTLL